MMQSLMQRLRTLPPSGYLGWAAIVLGSAWILFVVPSYMMQLVSALGDDFSFSLFSFVVGSFVSVLASFPGIASLYFGRWMLVEATETKVRVALVALTILASVVISGLFGAPIEKIFPNSIGIGVTILLATLVVIPPYLILCKWILAREKLAFRRYRDLIGTPILVVIAIELWAVSDDLIVHFVFNGERYRLFPEAPWMLLVTFTPEILAIGFYLVARRWAGLAPSRRKRFAIPSSLPRT